MGNILSYRLIFNYIPCEYYFVFSFLVANGDTKTDWSVVTKCGNLEIGLVEWNRLTVNLNVYRFVTTLEKVGRPFNS